MGEEPPEQRTKHQVFESCVIVQISRSKDNNNRNPYEFLVKLSD